MQRRERPFANTLDGANAEDVQGLAEHLSKEFPSDNDAISAMLRQPAQTRVKMLPRLVQRAIDGLLQQRMETMPLRSGSAALSEKEILAKAERDVANMSPKAIADMAVKQGISFEVAEMKLVQQIARGYRIGME